MNLNAYLDKVEFERIVTPEATDAHFMRVTGDRHGLKMQRVIDVQPVLEHVAMFRKINQESNGFWQGRTGRAIGSIPIDVMQTIRSHARGDEQEVDRLIKNWLKLHSEFCSVSVQSF